MQKNKLNGYINICRKANYLIVGGEALEKYNKKLYLVLFDINAGKSTLKIVKLLQERGIKTIAVENMKEISSIDNCKIVGIKNKQLSDIIENLCEEKE